METINRKKSENRIEIRVSDEDKSLFEQAQELSGFASFSEFIRFILSKESKLIVAENNRILASEKDEEIFFNAMMGNEEKANETFLKAIKDHRALVK